MKGNKYKNILEKLDINELKLCRNEKELRKYLKTKDINLTRAQVYELKEFYCRKIQNAEALSLEILDNVAGGIVLCRKSIIKQNKSIEQFEVFPSLLVRKGEVIHDPCVRPTLPGENPEEHYATITFAKGNDDVKTELRKVDDLSQLRNELSFDKPDDLKKHLIKVEKLSPEQVEKIMKESGLNEDLNRTLADERKSLNGNLERVKTVFKTEPIIPLPKPEENRLNNPEHIPRSSSERPYEPSDGPMIQSVNELKAFAQLKVKPVDKLDVQDLNAQTPTSELRVPEKNADQGSRYELEVAVQPVNIDAEVARPASVVVERKMHEYFDDEKDIPQDSPYHDLYRKGIAKPDESVPPQEGVVPEVGAVPERVHAAQVVEKAMDIGAGPNFADEYNVAEFSDRQVRQKKLDSIYELLDSEDPDKALISKETAPISEHNVALSIFVGTFKMLKAGVEVPGEYKEIFEGYLERIIKSTKPANVELKDIFGEFAEIVEKFSADSQRAVGRGEVPEVDKKRSAQDLQGKVKFRTYSGSTTNMDVPGSYIEALKNAYAFLSKWSIESKDDKITQGDLVCYRHQGCFLYARFNGVEAFNYNRDIVFELDPSVFGMFCHKGLPEIAQSVLGYSDRGYMATPTGNDFMSNFLGKTYEESKEFVIQGIFVYYIKRLGFIHEAVRRSYEKLGISGIEEKMDQSCIDIFLREYREEIGDPYKKDGVYRGTETNPERAIYDFSDVIYCAKGVPLEGDYYAKNKVLLEVLKKELSGKAIDKSRPINGTELYEICPEAAFLTIENKYELYKALYEKELGDEEIIKIIANDPLTQFLSASCNATKVIESFYERLETFVSGHLSENYHETAKHLWLYGLGLPNNVGGKKVPSLKLSDDLKAAIKSYVFADPCEIKCLPADPMVGYIMAEKEKPEEERNLPSFADTYLEMIPHLTFEERKAFLSHVAKCEDDAFLPCYEAALRKHDVLTENLNLLKKIYDNRDRDETFVLGITYSSLYKVLTGEQKLTLHMAERQFDLKEFILQFMLDAKGDLNRINPISFQSQLATFVTNKMTEYHVKGTLGETANSYGLIPLGSSSLEGNVNISILDVSSVDIKIFDDSRRELVKLTKLISDQLGLSDFLYSYGEFANKCFEKVEKYGFIKDDLGCNSLHRGFTNPGLLYKVASLIAACKSKNVEVKLFTQGEKIENWINDHSSRLAEKVQRNEPEFLAINIADGLNRFENDQTKLQAIFRSSDIMHFNADFQSGTDRRTFLVEQSLKAIDGLNGFNDQDKTKLKISYVKLILDNEKMFDAFKSHFASVTLDDFKSVDPFKTISKFKILEVDESKETVFIEGLEDVFKNKTVSDFVFGWKGMSGLERQAINNYFSNKDLGNSGISEQEIAAGKYLIEHHDVLTQELRKALAFVAEDEAVSLKDEIERTNSAILELEKKEGKILSSSDCFEVLEEKNSFGTTSYFRISPFGDKVEVKLSKSYKKIEREGKSYFIETQSKSRLEQYDSDIQSKSSQLETLTEQKERAKKMQEMVEPLLTPKTLEEHEAEKLLDDKNAKLSQEQRQILENFANRRTQALKYTITDLRGKLEELEKEHLASVKGIGYVQLKDGKYSDKTEEERRVAQAKADELLDQCVELDTQIQKFENEKKISEENDKKAIAILPSTKKAKNKKIAKIVGAATAGSIVTTGAVIGTLYGLGILGAAASSKPVVASSNNGNNDKDKEDDQDNNDNAA